MFYLLLLATNCVSVEMNHHRIFYEIIASTSTTMNRYTKWNKLYISLASLIWKTPYILKRQLNEHVTCHRYFTEPFLSHPFWFEEFELHTKKTTTDMWLLIKYFETKEQITHGESKKKWQKNNEKSSIDFHTVNIIYVRFETKPKKRMWEFFFGSSLFL